MQLGMHVPNARAQVFKASDIRAIIELQYVRTGSTVNACKAYRQTTTVRLQCMANTMDHSPATATVPKRLDSMMSYC
jgi:hypothetical protein